MDEIDDEPRRFRHYPYGPAYFGLVPPCIAMIGGVVLTAGGASCLSRSGKKNTIGQFAEGLALLGIAVTALLLASWQARRRL